MGGAILVAAPAYWYVRRRHSNLLGEATELPDRFKVDAPLFAGSAIFGLGWGLSGICPGPGLLPLTGGESLQGQGASQALDLLRIRSSSARSDEEDQTRACGRPHHLGHIPHGLSTTYWGRTPSTRSQLYAP